MATTVSIAGAEVYRATHHGGAGTYTVDVTLGGAADLTGKQVTLTNPDGSAGGILLVDSQLVPQQAPAVYTVYRSAVLDADLTGGALPALVTRGKRHRAPEPESSSQNADSAPMGEVSPACGRGRRRQFLPEPRQVYHHPHQQTTLPFRQERSPTMVLMRSRRCLSI